MKNNPVKFAISLVFGLCSLALVSVSARADSYNAQIAMLEVWKSGNVAFTLSASVPTCNSQFILNASDAGFKNLYSAVLAAKKTGTPIQVTTSGCGPADNYGGNYNIVLYLYVLD